MRKVCHPLIQAVKDMCGIDDGGPPLLTFLPAVCHRHAWSAGCSTRELAIFRKRSELYLRVADLVEELLPSQVTGA